MIFEKIREKLFYAVQEAKVLQETTDSYGYMMVKKGLNHATDIVNEVEAEYNNGWIDIKTKLPEYDEYVLCQGKNSQFIACIDSLDNKWKDGHFYVRTNITHWQPLPQPPKGE